MNTVIGSGARLMRGMVVVVRAVLLAGLAATASAEVVIYEHDNFQGRSFVASDAAPNLASQGFNDQVSSVEVRGGPWQFCEHAGFGGQCVVLNPGRYASLRAMGMNDRVSSLRPAGGGNGAAGPAAIELYEHDDFAGRVFRANGATPNLQPQGFNDTASSIVIHSGRWEVCSDAEYRGRCVTLDPGRYRRLREQELNDVISSLRPVGGTAGLPSPGTAAPGSPVVERAMFNTWRVTYPDGCIVYYNDARQRSTAEPGCSTGQLAHADDLMARGAGR